MGKSQCSPPFYVNRCMSETLPVLLQVLLPRMVFMSMFICCFVVCVCLYLVRVV